MKRENAFFDGSRLYRQAREGSTEIHTRLSTDPEPFKRPIELLSNQKSLAVNSVEDSRSLLFEAQSKLTELSRDLSPYIAVPTLLQLISDYYYGRYQQNPFWLGQSLKLSIAEVGRSVYQSSAGERKSIGTLEEVIRMASLIDRLTVLNSIFEVFGPDHDGAQAIVTGEGLSYTPMLNEIAGQYRNSFGMKGQIQRTVSDTSQAIWSQPSLSLGAIENVLSGQTPDKQPEFMGTLFSMLPSQNTGFWIGLWSRIQVFISAGRFQKAVTDDALSISIFESFGLVGNEPLDAKVLQAGIARVFWQSEWYERRISAWPANMIVERPVMRATAEQELFVTSIPIIIDSVNWFVEASILRYKDVGGELFPDAVFEQLVSQPFESGVCEIFHGNSFEAGGVNDDGVWHTQSRTVRLIHKNGEACPGQIDCLASHPDLNAVLVCECKVLSLPYANNKLRNVYAKISEVDDEGFHLKLTKKIEWLKGTNLFAGLPDRAFLGVVVLDQMVPGMNLKIPEEDSGTYFILTPKHIAALLPELLTSCSRR